MIEQELPTAKSCHAGLRLFLEQPLREQTRWFVAAWGVLVVAWATLVALNIAMWTRLP